MLPTTPQSVPLALTDQDLEALDRARGWARFMAIVGFILCGLFGLMMVMATVAMLTMPVPGGSASFVGISGLIGVGFLVAYFALLLRYASGIAAHGRGDGTGLARAFWGLKVLWIIGVVGYGFSILTTLAMTLAQLLGFNPGQPPG